MTKYGGSRKSSVLMPVALLVFFIINFRVEAGIATVLERMLDGLVGIAVLLGLLYVGARFFGFLPPANKDE
jgi:hypothetical protein